MYSVLLPFCEMLNRGEKIYLLYVFVANCLLVRRISDAASDSEKPDRCVDAPSQWRSGACRL